MSDDSRLMHTIRVMAWERAKGEMRSMLHSYWDDASAFRMLDHKIEAFIKDIEDNGYQE